MADPRTQYLSLFDPFSEIVSGLEISKISKNDDNCLPCEALHVSYKEIEFEYVDADLDYDEAHLERLHESLRKNVIKQTKAILAREAFNTCHVRIQSYKGTSYDIAIDYRKEDEIANVALTYTFLM